MKYVVRVVLGLVLGLLAAGLCWYLGVRWTYGAIAGALLAAIGFLGSFFLWTADRPEDGYEQVLFDMPNNLVTLALVVGMVGASFGGAHLHRGGPSGPDPAQVAAMDESHDNLTRIYNALQAGNYSSSAAATNASNEIAGIQDTLATLPASAKLDLLTNAATALRKALNGIESCTDDAGCQLAARLAKADALAAKAPLNEYAGA